MGKNPDPLALVSGMTFDSLLLVDDDRRYLQTNARGTGLLGATRETVLSSAIDDFTSPQFAWLLPDLWAALEKDGRLSGAYEVKRGDGKLGMIEFAAKRDLFDGQHLIVARELARSHAQAVGFALIDPRTGEIDEVSPTLCRLSGRSREAVHSAGLVAFGGPQQAATTLREMRAIAHGGQPSYEFRCPVERPSGGVQWLAVTLRAVTGARSHAVRILLEAIPLNAAELPDEVLTAREREVLQLAAGGGTAQTIAATLVLSPGTVRTHLRNIYGKLGTRDRAAAVAEGLRRGIID